MILLHRLERQKIIKYLASHQDIFINNSKSELILGHYSLFAMYVYIIKKRIIFAHLLHVSYKYTFLLELLFHFLFMYFKLTPH